MSYHPVLFILGLFLIVVVSFDVFQAVIVPRMTSRRYRIAPFLMNKIAWPFYRKISNYMQPDLRDRFLDSFGPGGFILLLMTWFLTLILGYSLVLFALGNHFIKPIVDLSQASYFAGSSVLTMGFTETSASDWTTRCILLSAAVLGIMFLGLQVSFLFALQTCLQQREQTVNMLTSRAGSPASGLVLLLRYKELNILSSLSTSFIAWESWIAHLFESHRAYVLLIYFRSSSPTNSWISSIGALCDTATLLSTTIKDVPIGEAELFYWLAITTLKPLCEYLELEPNEGEPLSRLEFDRGLEILSATGFELKDPETAWKRFSQRRSGYMQYLVPMSKMLLIPTQIWIPHLSI